MTRLVLGLVPSVWVAPVGKSGSFTLIRTVALPRARLLTSQSPFTSVETVCGFPVKGETVTSTFDIFNSPASCKPFPLRSK